MLQEDFGSLIMTHKKIVDSNIIVDSWMIIYDLQ